MYKHNVEKALRLLSDARTLIDDSDIELSAHDKVEVGLDYIQEVLEWLEDSVDRPRDQVLDF